MSLYLTMQMQYHDLEFWTVVAGTSLGNEQIWWLSLFFLNQASTGVIRNSQAGDISKLKMHYMHVTYGHIRFSFYLESRPYLQLYKGLNISVG